MKYIVTENQYKILLREDRVDYLRNQFVIDPPLLDDSTEVMTEKSLKMVIDNRVVYENLKIK